MGSKAALYIAWFAGAALLVGLLVTQGAQDVALAVAQVGWGLLVISLFHLVPMFADSMGWRTLFEPGNRPSILTLIRIRWIGEGINSLLPVARVGGELVRSRLVRRSGVPAPDAAASVVVDLTLAVLSQVVFIMLGLGLLIREMGGGRVVGASILGLGFLLLMLILFYVVQRKGLFVRLARALRVALGHERGTALSVHAEAIDKAIDRLYQHRRRLVGACLWRLAGWLTGAGEVWLALRFLGHPVGLGDAIMLESLGAAIRGAAFIVPGALGVQEGGFLVLGRVIGLSSEIALAMSFVKRVRELVLGVVALIVWQFLEGRAVWHRRRHRAEQNPIQLDEEVSSSPL